MRAGLVIDESEKYDGYNWHDVYAREFSALGSEVRLLDFKKRNWLDQIRRCGPNFLLWRAWHRPDDRDDAKNKIQFIENELGIPIFPNWDMYSSYDNKILQSYHLKRHGFKMPDTNIFRSEEEALSYAEIVDLPIISKCSEGACGDNVRLIRDREDLESHIKEAFSDRGIETYFPWIRQRGYVYLQKYLPIERDLRLITIGDRVELSFWRENEASWKKNISSGARINPSRVPDSAKEIALRLAKEMGFHWCAVDMAEHEGEMYVFEFSSVFGFSNPEDYERYFGSPNGHILRKQAEYLQGLFENEKN